MKIHNHIILARTFLITTILFVLILSGCSKKVQQTYQSDWPADITRTWIGPDYWSNPLQDWKINGGKLECLVSDFNRNVGLLTYSLSEKPGDLSMQVRLGTILPGGLEGKIGWAGFRVGAKGQFNDYRSDVLYGKGIDAGLSTQGHLFIGKFSPTADQQTNEKIIDALEKEKLQLKLELKRSDDVYVINLYVLSDGTVLDSTVKSGIKAEDVNGSLALVVDFPKPRLSNEFESYLTLNTLNKDNPSFWFADWNASGSKLVYAPEREFGPILFAQHTLSKGTLKMTAQMPPVSEKESQTVHFQLKNDSGEWQTIVEDNIHPLARTATFRVADWNDKQDVQYRLFYSMSIGQEQTKACYFSGTVRKDPVGKKEIVVAGFTGNNDLGFPNNELVEYVLTHNPDLLFFSGDQIYESVAGYGVQRSPLDKACLDYLRKWYLYGWEYREMLRNIPTVSIPDDHDVYHGNLWGESGKATIQNGTRKEIQDSGGYSQPAEWVKMVERTQTSHLPDPYDPTPVQQGIGVYYTDLVYGGVSFAIIEDRKFKSAPKYYLPKVAKVQNGWAENKNFSDPELFDIPAAELLGDRQIAFLEEWAKDWSNGSWMKVLLSQTIFSTVATLPDSAISDVVVPKLRVLKKGEYPENDKPTQDMDSDGWPKSARDLALRVVRSGFAFHLAGDQHLGSTIQYGIDEWGDASYALCVPSVSNYFPRRWFPKEGPENWKSGTPKNIGNFYDGFGNKMTVLAVSNPFFTGLQPSFLFDRAAGYGIVKMDRESRDIEVTNWPRQVNPKDKDAKPYDGWPVRFNQLDNYGRQASGYLPTINVIGLVNPVVMIINENTQTVEYSIRINGKEFLPKVFSNDTFTIKVGEPDLNKWQTFNNLKPVAQKSSKTLDISF